MPTNATVVITAEGRDAMNKEVHALTTRVVRPGDLQRAHVRRERHLGRRGLGISWGKSILWRKVRFELMDDLRRRILFPRLEVRQRRYHRARLIVYPSTDTTYPLPPNTDNVEWWANYSGVPPVPVLDFVTLHALSAAATGNDLKCVWMSFYSRRRWHEYQQAPARWDHPFLPVPPRAAMRPISAILGAIPSPRRILRAATIYRLLLGRRHHLR